MKDRKEIHIDDMPETIYRLMDDSTDLAVITKAQAVKNATHGDFINIKCTKWAKKKDFCFGVGPLYSYDYGRYCGHSGFSSETDAYEEGIRRAEAIIKSEFKRLEKLRLKRDLAITKAKG